MTARTRSAVAGLALWALAGCGGGSYSTVAPIPEPPRAFGDQAFGGQDALRQRIVAAGGFRGKLVLLDSYQSDHAMDMMDKMREEGVPDDRIAHPSIRLGRAADFLEGTSDRSPPWTRSALDDLVAETRVVAMPLLAPLRCPQDAEAIARHDIVFAVAGGNTDSAVAGGSRDLWQPDHPNWEDDPDTTNVTCWPFTDVGGYDQHFEAFATGKVLLAVYARPSEGGGFEPNEATVRCGEARDACMAVAHRRRLAYTSDGQLYFSSNATAELAVAAFYTAQLFDGAVEVVDTLKACAIDAGEEGVDDEFGLGVLNLACPEIENAEVRTASGSLRPAWSSPALDRLAFPPERGLSFDVGPAFADRRGRPLGRLGVSYGFRRGALALGAGREFSPLGVSSSLARASAGAYVAAAGRWRLSGDAERGLHAAAAAGRGGGALSPRTMRAGLLYGTSSDGVDWSAYAGRAWHRAAVGIPGHRDAGRSRSRASAAGWEARVAVRWRF